MDRVDATGVGVLVKVTDETRLVCEAYEHVEQRTFLVHLLIKHEGLGGGGGRERSLMSSEEDEVKNVENVENVENVYGTLHWHASEVVDATEIAHVQSAVRRAADARLRVRAISPHVWSWSGGVVAHGGITVVVRISGISYEGEAANNDVVVVGAGVLLSDLHSSVARRDLQLDAHGGCMTSRVSQTAGGAVATNVHHTGVPTFADRCTFVDVVREDASVARAFQGDDLWRQTIGGAGRTGVIVRVGFSLSERTFYTPTHSALHDVRLRESLGVEFARFCESYRGVPPMERIHYRSVMAGLIVSSTYERTEQRDDRRQLHQDYRTGDFGAKPLFFRYVFHPVDLVMEELPVACYGLWTACFIPLFETLFSDVPKRATICLDYACSSHIVEWDEHLEIAFFVPCHAAERFGEWLDRWRASSRILRHVGLVMRYVYGVDTRFSGNSPSTSNYLNVTFSNYHHASFEAFADELHRLVRDVRAEFGDELVRLHPGKFDPPEMGPKEASLGLPSMFAHDPHALETAAKYRRAPPLMFPAVVVAVGAFVTWWTATFDPSFSAADGKRFVALWWSFLSTMACVNLFLLARVFASTWNDRSWYTRRQRLLSTVFVVGCASRSIVVRGDVERLALLDTPLSAVAIGRSVATVAEVAFATQWTLLLHHGLARSGSRWRMLPLALTPLSISAQCFSWYAALTTHYLFSAIEETHWAAIAVLILVSFAALLRCPSCPLSNSVVRFCAVATAPVVAWLLFLVFLDVPTYTHYWLRDEAAGKRYLTVEEGAQQAIQWTVTWRYEDWEHAWKWMTPYFVVGSWISMSLVTYPDMRATQRGPFT